MTLNNSIIANSPDDDCVRYSGTVTAVNSLLEDTGAAACNISDGVDGNIIGQDPNLGPLQDNGGSTLTHALLGGSPAINAGSDALAVDGDGVALPYDQRGVGYPRKIGTVDMGAFEFPCSAAAFPWSVGTETALNDAISCFNTINFAGSYTISLTNNISLTASTITINNDNSTTGAELSIAGDGYKVDGQDLTDVRPFFVETNTVVTLNQLTITGGKVSGSGGGIRNLGFLTIQLSTIANNEAGIAGGGITNINSGTLTVTNSTISGNQATYGGGIYNNGTATVTNSTVSGNQAVDLNGGGIYNAVNLTLINSTLSDNEAQLGDGDGMYNDGALTLHNTVIANSPDDDCVNGSGTVTAVNSLLEDTGAAACNLSDGVDGNIIGQDPNLGPLQDNGGPTLTHALLVGSPAIAMGDAGICAAAAVDNRDQRGVARPQGAACDIGAYEFWGVGITAVTPTDAELSWQAANSSCTYDIFESTTPYFIPTEPSAYTTINLLQALVGKLGTVGTNYFYINRATCDNDIIAYSNEIGELDFAIVPGN